MSRKTIDVWSLRIQVNDMLKGSFCNADTRHGMISVLDSVLHQTGNYEGFRYLEASEVPVDCKAGINSNDGGKFPHSLDRIGTAEHYDEFKDTDETRRYYF